MIKLIYSGGGGYNSDYQIVINYILKRKEDDL